MGFLTEMEQNLHMNFKGEEKNGRFLTIFLVPQISNYLLHEFWKLDMF